MTVKKQNFKTITMGSIKDVFGKSKKEAEEVVNDEEKVEGIIDEAAGKAEKEKNSLTQIWHQLQLFISLLKDYFSGEYTYVPKAHIVLILAGVLYFILPFDFAPDFIPGIGYIDDAFVLSVIARQMIYILEEYETWKDNLTVSDDIPAS